MGISGGTRATRYPSAEDLLATAAATTGLDDFGPGDFRAGLDVLLESLEHDGDLGPDTDDAVLGPILRRLGNRLEVEAWLREHPDVTNLGVRAPLGVNGLPRTGTTALANLLSLDPQFRCLRQWEQMQPCPPPTVETEPDDPRRIEAARINELMPPELKVMHLYELDATVEDTEVLGMAFHGQQFTLPVWSYHAWWRDADLTSTFAYHRRVLQLLQSQRPPDRWLFKAPHHKFHLEALLSAYPDARFVMTHRDPAKAIPSYASLVSTLFPPAAGGRDLRTVGPRVSEHLRIGMERAIAARRRVGEDRFLDVHHGDLVRDPMGCLQRVYDFAGLELDPSVEQRMVEWTQQNRPGSHGTHRYTAEQFGLHEAEIRDDYDFYLRRFDVEIEGT
jgi:hypothetical protein